MDDKIWAFSFYEQDKDGEKEIFLGGIQVLRQDDVYERISEEDQF